MRAFARAKEAFDAYAKSKAKNKPPLERTRMIKLVEEISFEIAREGMKR